MPASAGCSASDQETIVISERWFAIFVGGHTRVGVGSGVIDQALVGWTSRKGRSYSEDSGRCRVGDAVTPDKCEWGEPSG